MTTQRNYSYLKDRDSPESFSYERRCIMTDNVLKEHIALFKEIVSSQKEYAEKTDKINARLTKIIIVMAICFTIAVVAIVGLKDYFYFFSPDIDYPEVTQTQSEDSSYQNIK